MADQQGHANVAAMDEGVGQPQEAGAHQQEAGDLGEAGDGQPQAVEAQSGRDHIGQPAEDLGGDQGADHTQAQGRRIDGDIRS